MSANLNAEWRPTPPNAEEVRACPWWWMWGTQVFRPAEFYVGTDGAVYVKRPWNVKASGRARRVSDLGSYMFHPCPEPPLPTSGRRG